MNYLHETYHKKTKGEIPTYTSVLWLSQTVLLLWVSLSLLLRVVNWNKLSIHWSHKKQVHSLLHILKDETFIPGILTVLLRPPINTANLRTER